MKKREISLSVEMASLKGWVIEPDEPRAAVAVAHGMAEHKERYLSFAERLAGEGYAVLLYDMRGHGASARDRDDLGYFGPDGADRLVSDLGAAIKWLKKEYPGLPVSLFAHSMGTLTGRVYLRDYARELDSAVMTGPPSYSSALPVGRMLALITEKLRGERFRGKMFDKMLFGAFNKPFKADGTTGFEWLSRDPTVSAAYKADPYCGYVFTVNGYRVLFELTARAFERGYLMSDIALPVTLLAGGEDPCVAGQAGFERSLATLRNGGARSVEGRLFPGMRHELINEIDNDEVFTAILEGLSLRRAKE